MQRRLKLHEELVELLGSRNVYFNPPSSIRMKYPCIVYERDGTYADHADDIKYRNFIRYKITVIDEDPDSEIVEKMMNFKHTSYDRPFISDNLNHDVFTTYY